MSNKDNGGLKHPKRPKKDTKKAKSGEDGPEKVRGGGDQPALASTSDLSCLTTTGLSASFGLSASSGLSASPGLSASSALSATSGLSNDKDTPSPDFLGSLPSSQGEVTNTTNVLKGACGKPTSEEGTSPEMGQSTIGSLPTATQTGVNGSGTVTSTIGAPSTQTGLATSLGGGQQGHQVPPDTSNQAAWSPSLYNGGATLDSDTINYIHRIYCRECRMEEQRRQKEAAAAGGGGVQSPTSPQTVVEDQSLQQTMDKNKESLKRKLMLRRSVNELVDQGIYPPLKTPPAFAEQSKQLERAKTGDLLRHKIQQRPDRQALVQQHILEESKAAPSLQDRQRQLKKARLQDSLSDRLANRPGPLELVQGNILQTDPSLKDAIIEGKIQFMKTNDVDHKEPVRHFVFDDDSNPSDGVPSPVQLFLGADGEFSQSHFNSGSTSSSGSTGIPTPPDITPFLQNVQSVSGPGAKTFIFTSNVPPISSNSFTTSPTGAGASLANTSGLSRNGSPGSSSNSSKLARLKKPKPKSTPKAKVIKFHEYKGPPNVVKNQQSQSPSSSSSSSISNPISTSNSIPPCPVSANNILTNSNSSETPYHILLQQQQLFLQWQLEFHQKSMPFILPTKGVEGGPIVSQLPSSASSTSSLSPPLPPLPPSSFSLENSVVPPVVLSTATATTSTVTTTTTSSTTHSYSQPHSQSRDKIKALEDLKVADLKCECKKRNLPVSGPKPHLLERLKPYADDILSSFGVSVSSTPTTSTIQTILSSSCDNSLTSPPSVQSLSGLINIQPVTPQSVAASDESASIYMGSPPISPTSSVAELNLSHSSLGPMSPDNMDTMIASPPMFSIGNGNQVISKAQVASQAQHLQQQVTQAVPMLVDQQSRPPSVAPMDVDLGGSQTNLAAMSFMAPSPASSVDHNQNPGFPNSAAATQVLNIQVPVQAPSQVGQPQAISQEDLLRQQQKKIEELQRQLQQSQLRLKEAQGQKDQQLRQQLNMAPAPIHAQPQPPPPPPLPPTLQAPLLQQNLSPVSEIKTSMSTSLSQAQTSVAQLHFQPVHSQAHLAAASTVNSTTTTTSTPNASTLTKDVVANLLQIRALKQGINLNNQKVIQVTTATPNTQSFVFTAPQTHPQQQDPNSSANGNNKAKVATLPINGINTSRASSVPSSPSGHGVKLQRSTTSPFFTNVPHAKEPPKYDEAMKNRQNLLVQQQNSPVDGATQNGSSALLPIKSQVMDDVLEILIRTGELPPSAAQEPPPTPKTQAITSTAATVSAMSLAGSVNQDVSAGMIPTSSGVQFTTASLFSSTTLSSSQANPMATMSVFTPSPSPPALGQVGSPSTSCTSPLSNGFSPVILSPPGALSPGSSFVLSPPGALSPTGLSIKREPPPPLSLTSCFTTNGPPSEGSDLTYSLADQLASNIGDLPFITMDWSDSDTNINTMSLDLPDMLDTPDPLGLSKARSSGQQDLFNLPGGSSKSRSGGGGGGGEGSGSVLGSEPNLNALELNDTEITEESTGLSMDVSDWLDVIMPSTGLTPLSANAPVSFPSDPILTPKPQDVLDLFNMEESDLYTPTEINVNFDKAMETTAFSKS